MIKQYQLIKKYPRSNKNHNEYVEVGTVITMDDSKGQTCYFGKGITLKPEEITNNWKLLPVRLFEILSFKVTGTDYKINLQPNGLYFPEIAPTTNGVSLESRLDCVDKNTNTIYSIKRLSDNQVFKIGDVVSGINIRNERISKFEISRYNNVLQIFCDSQWISLENITPGQIPLFTTEDGVNIYNPSDTWWVYNTKNKDLYHSSMGGQLVLENITLKRFSTSMAANKWIEMKASTLSITDILEVVNLDESQIEKLIDIINSKR